MSEKNRYVVLSDGTVWPRADFVGEAEWNLRYGRQDNGEVMVLSVQEGLFLASICAAYREVMTRPEFKGKPVLYRRAVEKKRPARSKNS